MVSLLKLTKGVKGTTSDSIQNLPKLRRLTQPIIESRAGNVQTVDKIPAVKLPRGSSDLNRPG